MNTLRATLLTALLLPDAMAMPVDQYTFQVLLDGSPIGSHTFQFEAVDNGYHLTSTAEYQVKIFFVPVYRYQHRSEEFWQNGCLEQISSQTNDNGKDYRVVGQQLGDSFMARINDQEQAYQASCVGSFAYWQPELLDRARLLNSQTGNLDEVSFADAGMSSLPWEGAKAAESILLKTGQGDVTVWHSEGRWLGLRSILENGRELVYKPAPVTSTGGVEQPAEDDAMDQMKVSQ